MPAVRLLSRCLLVACVVVGLAACGDEAGPPPLSDEPVPDVRGMTLREAERQFEQRRLEWGLDPDGFVYSAATQSSGGENRDLASSRVVAQEPGPGARLSFETFDSIVLAVEERRRERE